MEAKKILALGLVLTLPLWGWTQVNLDDLDIRVAETKVEALPYRLNEIVVRGFDGQNPPPRLSVPERPILYGYGMTAYVLREDTLIFFNILYTEAVHRGENGAELARYKLPDGKYTDPFKNYFVRQQPETERKNIYFEEIYLKDKKGNYIKLTVAQPMCPTCQ